MPKVSKYIWIRHAPISRPELLCGATDIGIKPLSQTDIMPLRDRLSELGAFSLYSSPARRCIETVKAVLPDHEPVTIPEFWEQNFGDLENTHLANIPDLGALTRAEIAAFRNPNGESFLEVVKRVRAGLEHVATDKPAVIFAHAGVIRAALSIALQQDDAGIAFQVNNLSMTEISFIESANEWAIGAVNA